MADELVDTRVLLLEEARRQEAEEGWAGAAARVAELAELLRVSDDQNKGLQEQLAWERKRAEQAEEGQRSAQQALANERQSALGVVAARLGGFESRLAALEARVPHG